MQLQRFPLIILAFAIGSCSVPNDAELEQERTTSADAAIRSLPVDDWCKAEADRDIEAKMKLFMTDAVLMPPGKSDVIGQQAIRAWHEKMWKGTKYQCSGTIDEVQVFGDWGMVRGTFSGVFTPASGAPQRVSGRFLNTVRRQADGSWKIARGIWNSELPLPGVEDTSEADREAINTVTEQSREAYMARDWDRFSGHFTEGAIWMPDNVLPLTGKAAWWSFVEQFWDSTAVVEMDLVSEEIIVAGDWAFQRMTETTVTVPTSGDGESSTSRFKILWLFHREADGSWKIARFIWNWNPAPN